MLAASKARIMADVCTGTMLLAHADLALWLVGREWGAELAAQISQVIAFRWFRPCPAPLEGESSLFVMPVEQFEREP